MRLIERLSKKDAPLPTGIPAIVAWRAYVVERQDVDVAFRRAEFGGPYSPPSVKTTAEAEVFIRWADGTCTAGALNRAQLANPEEGLHMLHAQAYADPYPEVVPGHTDPPELTVCVPEVRDAVLHGPDRFVAPVQALASELKGVGTDQVRAELGAEYGRITFLTSEGANSFHETTRVIYNASLASRASFAHDLRRLPTPEQMLARARRVREDFQMLGQPFEGTLHAPQVLLTPSLTRQFLGYFLLQNLSMQAILNGASAFTREQLDAHAQIFHPSLNITDHPRRDEHPSAFRLCQRGQAPLERPLIAEGRLVAADISLRAATQGGMEPTATSLTENWIIDGPEPPELLLTQDRLLESVEEAVLVYSVLGLHTQDHVHGAYSLGVPRALVVRSGRIRGFVRGTIMGNFFDDLRQPLSPLIDPLGQMPILPVQARFVRGN